jgi:hypothetical protein
MEPRFHRARLCVGDTGDFFEWKSLDVVQQQGGPLRQGQFVEQLHHPFLLFLTDEHVVRFVVGDGGMSNIYAYKGSRYRRKSDSHASALPARASATGNCSHSAITGISTQ